ncbi:MAG: hypothetical protein OEZ02_05305 [Anaerolineae bacterium]|nr:hypothetical protein [Anaerolineae bacterium]
MERTSLFPVAAPLGCGWLPLPHHRAAIHIDGLARYAAGSLAG